MTAVDVGRLVGAYKNGGVLTLVGDCRAMLERLPAEYFQCVVTSPPYWKLRDYGHPDQIGREPTPEQYVANLVDVFAKVRRTLRSDGVLWLNLGDSYSTRGTRKGHANGGLGEGRHDQHSATDYRPVAPGLKEKDLVGIPWRVALALQADGWYLRSDVIWHKPNPMPESVEDRPTKAHEYMFLLTKSDRYFYDADAIAEPATNRDPGNKSHKGATARAAGDVHHQTKANLASVGARETRNRRTVWAVDEDEYTQFLEWKAAQRIAPDVWSIGFQPFRGAHFAVFPPALAEPCILAGSAPRACEVCGAPWRRLVDRTTLRARADSAGTRADRPGAAGHDAAARKEHMTNRGSGLGVSNAHNDSTPTTARRVTVGWESSCACADTAGTARCHVLDPFGGAATVGLVGDRLGRGVTLIEVNPDHAALGSSRMAADSPLFMPPRMELEAE